ncbi:MAG: hypothetical protein RIC19_01375 [Phaeodactylibacter sp.]|uniref:hypothetical protein n=1 Tax=Phaeodactylibacter sp. TaxID=1940289 RepID=UPI0032ECB3DB
MKKGFLLFDFGVQTLLLAIIAGSALYALAAPEYLLVSLFFAMPLGGWQLISGALKAFFLKSKMHSYYTLSAVIYLMLLTGGATYLPPEATFNPFKYGYLGNAVFWFPAIFGAVWYARQTWKDYQHAVEWGRPAFV